MRKIKNSIRNILWKELKVKPKLKSGIELKIESDNDFFVFSEIFLNKEYDEAINIFLQDSVEDPIILDLGANVGYFTLHIADELLLKKIDNFLIYSVEASKKNFCILKERINQASLHGKIIPNNGLVGLKEGFSYLSLNTNHYGFAINKKSRNSEKVNYIDIEKLINAPQKSISFIKCDIEGSEETFLSTYFSLLNRTNLIVIEFHDLSIQHDKCIKYLSKAGLTYICTINENSNFKTTVQVFKRLNSA